MFHETIAEFINYAELQTLQHLAAVRLAISVCESENIQQTIKRFRRTNGTDSSIGFSDDQWKQLRVQVTKKLTTIGIPHIIIDIILKSVVPISLEISKWILYHMDDMDFDHCPNFRWTPQITINYKKTVKIMVKNEMLDIGMRFRLACLHCLECEVRSLWDEMSLSERRSFFVRGNLKKPEMNLIVLYWSYYIQEVPIDYWGCKELNYTKLLIYAVRNGYLRATKFFLKKVKPGLRKRMIMNCMQCHLYDYYRPKSIVRDQLAIASFLVCELPARDIHAFFTLSFVFEYFLEWPLQKHFMTVVNRLRNFLNWKFEYLLERIFSKIIGGFECHYYKIIFIDFWNLCPEEVKTKVRTSQVGYQMFMKFVQKNFGFVFEKNSFAIKAKFRAIVLQQDIPENVEDFYKVDVEFFKFLVQEKIPTKEFIERLLDGNGVYSFGIMKDVREFSILPHEELLYLIDGILETNRFRQP